MAKLYLYDITNPNPANWTETRWADLYAKMRKSGWYRTPGQRTGFVNLVRENGAIAGYFAHEGNKRAVQYDDNKEQLAPGPFYSFEHLFFMLFEDTGQLLLQSRNIYDYRDLGLPIMRDSLFGLLAELFRAIGAYVAGRNISVENAGATHTQEELFATFSSIAQVTELEISALHEGQLPSPDDPRYRLFNPKVEFDPITWEAVAETQRLGLDHVTMQSVDSPDCTLRAPIPKALAAIGRIEKIRGHDHEGRMVYRERREDAEIEIELPLEPAIVPGLVSTILERLESRARVETWRERQQRRENELDHGPLFQNPKEGDTGGES